MTLTVTLTLTVTTLPKSINARASSNGDQLVILSTYVTAITISKPRSSTIPHTPLVSSSFVSSRPAPSSNSVSARGSFVTASSGASLSQALSSSSLQQLKGSNNAWKLGLAIGIPGVIALVIGLAAALLIITKKRKFARETHKLGREMPILRDLSFHKGEAASLSTYSCEDLEKNDADMDPFPERKHDASSTTPTGFHNQSMAAMKNRISRLFNWRNDQITAEDPIISQVAKSRSQMPDGACTPFTAMLLKRFKLRTRTTNKSPVQSEPPLPAIGDRYQKYFAPKSTDAKGSSLSQGNLAMTQHIGPGSEDYLCNSPGITSENAYLVIRKYTLKLPDEMSLEIGDTVVVFEQFSDGWCKAGRGAHMGIVPQICLKKI